MVSYFNLRLFDVRASAKRRTPNRTWRLQARIPVSSNGDHGGAMLPTRRREHLDDAVDFLGHKITRECEEEEERRDCNGPTVSVLQAKRHPYSEDTGDGLIQGNSLAQNQFRFKTLCPGTCTFMPHMPVMMFMGSTMVPNTVNLLSISFVFSPRSFMRMLIWAR